MIYSLKWTKHAASPAWKGNLECSLPVLDGFGTPDRDCLADVGEDEISPSEMMGGVKAALRCRFYACHPEKTKKTELNMLPTY